MTKKNSASFGIESISFDYKKGETVKGYNDRTLKIELSQQEIGRTRIYSKPVSEKMKDIFIGGKGFCLKLLWDSVRGTEKGVPTHWDDSENALCIASGPLGGTPVYPGAGKSIVATISPLTDMPIDSNVGGHFGPFLKFSGYDALEITGKSKEEVIIFIDGVRNLVQIFRADCVMPENIKLSHEISDYLTKHFGKNKPQDISVVSTGPGAKNSRMGCLNFTWYDQKRKRVRYKQAGRGGTGTVFADKGIKAIVCRWSSVKMNTNQPADIEALKAVSKKHAEEIRKLDKDQNEMSAVGTTHLVEFMNTYDLLPVNNFQFGSHPLAVNLYADVFRAMFDKGFDGCWKGCPVACAHGIKNFTLNTGPLKGQKVWVDGPEYETIASLGSNLGIFDPDFVAEMNFYCDTYGIDTISFGVAVAFLFEVLERDLLEVHRKDKFFGNKYLVASILHGIGRGEKIGLSDVVRRGIKDMKEYFSWFCNAEILDDIGMESKGLEFSLYITKDSLAQQGGYGFALKGAQHDEAWLIFLDKVLNHMPTFEQKAEALHWFPMWRTWFSLCGLCKLPWNDIVPNDNKYTDEPAKVKKHVEWYADFYSAVVGKKITPDELIFMSEKVYNFQRLFNLRMDFGTSDYDEIPYRAMGPATAEEYESRQEEYDKKFLEKDSIDVSDWSVEERVRIMRMANEYEYKKLKKAVYKRRGWTKNGIPTMATVKRLGIDFPEVLELLKKHGVKK